MLLQAMPDMCSPAPGVQSQRFSLGWGLQGLNALHSE